MGAPARESQWEDLGGHDLNPLVLVAFIPVSPNTLAGETDPECRLTAAWEAPAVGEQGKEGYVYLEKDPDSTDVHQESAGLQKA